MPTRGAPKGIVRFRGSKWSEVRTEGPQDKGHGKKDTEFVDGRSKSREAFTPVKKVNFGRIIHNGRHRDELKYICKTHRSFRRYSTQTEPPEK